jgi:hypothetical protein
VYKWAVFATVSKNYSTPIFRVCVKRVGCSPGIRADDHSDKYVYNKEKRSHSESLKFVVFPSSFFPEDGVSFS